MTMITIDTPVHPATAQALQCRQAGKTLAMLAARLERRRLPRPGGAAREYTLDIPLDNGESLGIILPSMAGGGRIIVVHRLERASLHAGRILRVPRTTLPETLLTAAVGRPLGSLVDLSGSSIAEIGGALITDVFDTDHDGQALLFHTDARTILPTFEVEPASVSGTRIGRRDPNRSGRLAWTASPS